MSDMSKIPATPHWGIILGASVHHEGDERSRTHPGHGYPAYTEHYTTYEPYTDRDEWIRRIERLTKDRTRFVAVEAKPVSVTTKVEISVGG